MRANHLLFLLVFLSTPGMAHSIYMECSETSSNIECQAGFSDGSSAEHLPFEVISYDDEALVDGETNADSRFSFQRPTTDFFILLDAGPGHVVEVDMEEIAAN